MLGTPTAQNWPGAALLPNYVEFEPRTPMNLAELFSRSHSAELDLLKGLLALDPTKRLNATQVGLLTVRANSVYIYLFCRSSFTLVLFLRRLFIALISLFYGLLYCCRRCSTSILISCLLRVRRSSFLCQLGSRLPLPLLLLRRVRWPPPAA